ncbi:YHS domain-containing (seleno)protein [Inquilinus limosus]|uniref:YHS domain-containing (seleno)protein n=1 Tax=Inquilinus limosus TaxID=171674 RepID=UPI0003FDDB49|nr:YHS domain-containing (seleno)protein [Inquilinus limosus]
MIRRTVLALAALACIAPAIPAARAEAPRPVNTLGSTDSVAIRGYDPVAYFREGAPRQGKPEFAVQHDSATWWFASAENKAQFESDPQKYLPAFGGFCAYGTSQGYLVKVEPEAWSIVDGRLYLNYDLGVREMWLKDTKGYIEKANSNWPGLDHGDIK